MQFLRLPKLEASVLSNTAQQFNTKPFSIPIKNETGKLEGYTLRPVNGFTGYFYDESVKKEKIVLHFTAGHLKGDLASLTSKQRGHVSVPFVIGRDGKLFQLFSSAAWSYHLGRGAKGGNKKQSRVSIGIELSNFGPLKLVDGNLETIYSRLPGNNFKKHIYCSETDTYAYIKLDQPFRGYEYFANYTDEQYNTLITLLRYLTAQYEIPRKFLPQAERFKATDKVVAFKGIVTHVNYRETGKWDMGPAFDWDRVISGVKGKNFTGKPSEHLDLAQTQIALTKAKEELAIAQAKVNDLKAKMQALKSDAGTTRGGNRSSGSTLKVMTTEEEINKTLKGKGTTRGGGRGATTEPQELSAEEMIQFYIE